MYLWIESKDRSLIGRHAAQTVSSQAVYVINHQRHVSLTQVIEASPFRDDIADEFMISLELPLLPGCVGIAEIDLRSNLSPSGTFHEFRRTELSAVVSLHYLRLVAKELDGPFHKVTSGIRGLFLISVNEAQP